MLYSDRAVAQFSQGKDVCVEPLEGRRLLSASLDTSNAVGDFNGDGKADLASLTTLNLGKKSSSSALVVQLGQGNGVFVTSSVQLVTGKPSAVLSGDFNGDKKQDVALLSSDASGAASVTLYLGDGKGGLTAGTAQSVGTLPLANVTAGDVNGDGFADLLSWNSNNVFVALNDGTGKLLPAVQQDNPFGTSATPAAAGDLDGDGRPELLGVNGSSLLGNKATASTGTYMLTFLPVLGSSIPLANKKLLVADVNGDGVNDLIAIGDGSVNVALQMTKPGEDPTFAAWVRTSGGDISPSKILVGDVTGDGKADVFQTPTDINLVSRAKLVLVSNGDGTFHKLIADNGHGDGHGHGDDDDDDNDDHDHDGNDDHDHGGHGHD